MPCDTPYYVLPSPAATEKIPVPCGKCPPCKKRRVDTWVFRLQREYDRTPCGLFVTLTYDTQHVPISDNGFMSLRKKDFQDFIKRLRKILGKETRIKYYAAGEYGSQNSRPHYHAIIFGTEDTAAMARAWSPYGTQIGTVHFGKITQDSCAYTLKYIDKSNFQKKHARDDRQPEFALMSKGIGSNYLTPQIVKYHKDDLSRMYVTRPGGVKTAMPKYYRRKIYDEDDLKKQLPIIQQAIADNEQALREQYLKAYGGSTDEAHYQNWLTSQKYGRYQSFYNALKDRKL